MEMLNLLKRNSSKRAKSDNNSLVSSIRTPIKIGAAMIAILVLTLFVWGGFAPLKSAAIASGKLIITEQNKIIQHLEGGVITEILVKEGDLVTKNQPLLSINDLKSSTRLQLLRLEYNELLASEIRLIAERNSEDILDFSKLEKVDLPQEEIDSAIKNQTEIFEISNKTHKEKLDIINKKIEQMESEISGLTAQKTSLEKSISISKEQLETYEKLLKDGYVPRIKVMELMREISNLEGQIAEITSEIAKVKQTIGETELSRINLTTQRYEKIATELKDNQKNLANIKEQIIEASDVLSRTTIKAPIAGVITGLKHHTIGGVIASGQEILQIVPKDDNLLVEAMLSPNDIDLVTKNLEARVHLTAFKSRNLPMLHGSISYVSADSFVDNVTGKSYYNVYVKLDKIDEKHNIKLHPGMPAEIYITTGEKTLLSYLLDPITDTMRKSFREE